MKKVFEFLDNGKGQVDLVVSVIIFACIIGQVLSADYRHIGIYIALLLYSGSEYNKNKK